MKTKRCYTSPFLILFGFIIFVLGLCMVILAIVTQVYELIFASFACFIPAIILVVSSIPGMVRCNKVKKYGKESSGIIKDMYHYSSLRDFTIFFTIVEFISNDGKNYQAKCEIDGRYIKYFKIEDEIPILFYKDMAILDEMKLSLQMVKRKK